MKYLAIAQNSEVDMNITFNASSLDNSIKVLQKLVKNGTMFQMFKVVELDTMQSKKVYFGYKTNRS